jgi:ERO1-like protein beta
VRLTCHRLNPQSHCHREGEYVDLSLNPERFTGYGGISAHRVWKTIYEENCFEESESSLSKMSKPGVVLPDTMAEVLYMDGDIPQEQCLEKKVYYKIISGAITYHVQKSESDALCQRAPCIDLYAYLSRASESDNRSMGIHYCFTQRFGCSLITRGLIYNVTYPE